MGGMFSSKSPKIETTEAVETPVLATPVEASTEAATASDLERRRRIAASGRSDTVLTSGMGLTSTASTGKGQTLG